MSKRQYMFVGEKKKKKNNIFKKQYLKVFEIMAW